MYYYLDILGEMHIREGKTPKGHLVQQSLDASVYSHDIPLPVRVYLAKEIIHYHFV